MPYKEGWPAWGRAIRGVSVALEPDQQAEITAWACRAERLGLSTMNAARFAGATLRSLAEQWVQKAEGLDLWTRQPGTVVLRHCSHVHHEHFVASITSAIGTVVDLSVEAGPCRRLLMRGVLCSRAPKEDPRAHARRAIEGLDLDGWDMWDEVAAYYYGVARRQRLREVELERRWHGEVR